jgi:hypothetical protein
MNGTKKLECYINLAVKACKGQTLSLTLPIFKLQRKLSFVSAAHSLLAKLLLVCFFKAIFLLSNSYICYHTDHTSFLCNL